ncbi:hypothetical protein AAMO2058_000233700 [Amorphochlora amoebiformis]
MLAHRLASSRLSPIVRLARDSKIRRFGGVCLPAILVSLALMHTLPSRALSSGVRPFSSHRVASSRHSFSGKRGLMSALKWVFGPLVVTGSICHVSGAEQREGFGSCVAKATGVAKTIDSHIHVWGKTNDKDFPFDNDPPEPLAHGECTAEAFMEKASLKDVNGALIVQPINYMFDHTYVTSILKRYPSFFRGMALANPKVNPGEVDAYLDKLKTDGYIALRFNPYLWEGSMADDAGKEIYAKAGEKGMSVGVMCFKGLPNHIDDIKSLIQHSPKTSLIIDHWGFFRQPATGGLDPNTKINEDAWQQLLDLSRYPNVYVKLSALFRVSGDEKYHDLRPRLKQLVDKFGAKRLMWGSDYPYALLNGGYECSVDALKQWHESGVLTSEEFEAICGGTATKLFG